jgi:iron(III) transport system substrate-binding protein
MKLRNVAGMAAAATMSISLVACAGAGDEGSTAVLYTPNNENAVGALIDQASAQDTGVEIDVVTGGSTALLERIKAESGNSVADLFWSTSSTVLSAFADQLQPYDSPELDGFDAEFLPGNSLWAPSTTHVIVLMVNTSQLGGLPEPTSWEDLADPAWHGKITVADPAASQTAFNALYGILQVAGDEVLHGILDNAVIARESSAVQTSVAQGEYTVGLAYEAASYPYVAGGQEEISLAYPDEGTFAWTESVALVKDAPHVEDAQKIYDLILSKDTQIAMLEDAFRRPARNDIKVSDYSGLPDLTAMNIVVMDKVTPEERDAFLAELGDVG